MLRSIRLLTFAVALLLMLASTSYAYDDGPSVKDAPPPPIDGVLHAADYPQRTSSQPGEVSTQAIATCTIFTWEPDAAGVLEVESLAEQRCTATVSQSLTSCVQAWRYYTTWVTQGCDTRAGFTVGLDAQAFVPCLRGTFWYRTRANGSYVDLDGRSYSSPYVYSNSVQITC